MTSKRESRKKDERGAPVRCRARRGLLLQRGTRTRTRSSSSSKRRQPNIFLLLAIRVRPLSDGSNPWSTSLVKSQKSVPLAALFADQGEVQSKMYTLCVAVTPSKATRWTFNCC